jgi:hypothetical protein
VRRAAYVARLSATPQRARSAFGALGRPRAPKTQECGGGTGIRTLETLAGLPVFKTGARGELSRWTYRTCARHPALVGLPVGLRGAVARGASRLRNGREREG